VCYEVALLIGLEIEISRNTPPIDMDLPTSPELDMSSGSAELVRVAPLGPRAMSHIRLQRVRGLDRVLRGRPDARSAWK